MSVALDIDEDYAGTLYGYSVIRTATSDGTVIFRIWRSSGPLSGRHIGGEFDTFSNALSWLAKVVQDDEEIW